MIKHWLLHSKYLFGGSVVSQHWSQAQHHTCTCISGPRAAGTLAHKLRFSRGAGTSERPQDFNPKLTVSRKPLIGVAGCFRESWSTAKCNTILLSQDKQVNCPWAPDLQRDQPPNTSIAVQGGSFERNSELWTHLPGAPFSLGNPLAQRCMWAHARLSPSAQHCRFWQLMGCVPEPSMMFAELFSSDSAPPISPEQELSPRGGLILLLLPAPCSSSSSQLARNTGLGVSSWLCSSQGPAPDLCWHQQGLHPAPLTGL